MKPGITQLGLSLIMETVQATVASLVTRPIIFFGVFEAKFLVEALGNLRCGST